MSVPCLLRLINTIRRWAWMSVTRKKSPSESRSSKTQLIFLVVVLGSLGLLPNGTWGSTSLQNKRNRCWTGTGGLRPRALYVLGILVATRRLPLFFYLWEERRYKSLRTRIPFSPSHLLIHKKHKEKMSGEGSSLVSMVFFLLKRKKETWARGSISFFSSSY